jgi:hypothetical protein
MMRGDAYINFVYSLAVFQRKGRPSGAKVKELPSQGLSEKQD